MRTHPLRDRVGGQCLGGSAEGSRAHRPLGESVPLTNQLNARVERLLVRLARLTTRIRPLIARQQVRVLAIPEAEILLLDHGGQPRHARPSGSASVAVQD